MTVIAEKKRKSQPPKRQSSETNLKRKSLAKEKEEEDLNKHEDDHPFRIGSSIVVRWPVDQSFRFCDVIERCRDEKAGTWRYYVHYHDFNRRMDDWVTMDQIVKPPSKAGAEYKAIKEAKEREKALEEKLSLADLSEEAGIRTRRQKRKGDGDGPDEVPYPLLSIKPAVEHDEHEGLDEEQLKEHEEVTKVKNVRMVELGRYRMETWYYSPFPKELFSDTPTLDVLYFDEATMMFFRHKEELLRWQRKHPDRHPPGNEIYRDEKLSMFEVDGAEQKIYCQNLCYFAKLFLDHKTLYYDVDPFLFYVLCEHDNRGYHPVGYYSKEKYSDAGYNLACILTFPSYQRKGYGRFLINFSYELSKKEEKVGSPEKPLSDLGLVSYRSYWASTLLPLIKSMDAGDGVCIMDLSKRTSILSEDIVSTLTWLGLLRYISGQYVVYAPMDLIDDLIKKFPVKPPVVDASLLHWAPLITDVKRDRWSIYSKLPPPDLTLYRERSTGGF